MCHTATMDTFLDDYIPLLEPLLNRFSCLACVVRAPKFADYNWSIFKGKGVRSSTRDVYASASIIAQTEKMFHCLPQCWDKEWAASK